VKNTYVIIPAYNEEKYISAVIKKTKKYCKNIIVVDDGSKDKTVHLVKKEQVDLLQHKKNAGKGIALKTGCNYAVKKGAEILIVLDADGQHDPSFIPAFISAITKQKKDIVFGARKFSRQMPFLFRFGNWFISMTISALHGIRLKDTQSGFRAFTAQAYKKIKWTASRYAVESEMIARAGRKGLKYVEIDIPTIYKDKYKGTTPLDGAKIVSNILWWRFSKYW